MKRRLKKIFNTIFKPGSDRRMIMMAILRMLHIHTTVRSGYYNTWAHQQYDRLPLQPIIDQIDGPLISIVVPAYNTPSTYFYELIYSIISQAYPNWELIIVDASNKLECKKIIEDSVHIDTRIRVIDFANQGISTNTNKGIEVAKGEYVAFVDHDDTLDPFALYEVAKAIKAEDADLIYSDEDKISADGSFYFDPHFKPDWSPDLLTHVNYTNHLSVVRKSLLDKVSHLNPEKDGAQDYDLILRLTDQNPRISHISKVLYHWRAALNSTATDFSSKRNITDAGTKALQEHFDRINLDVKVKAQEDRPGFYEIKHAPPKAVSLIITPFTSDAMLRLFTEIFLSKTDLSSIELDLIIPEGVAPRSDFDNCKITTLAASSDFFHKAVTTAKNESLIVINQILFPTNEKWLEQFSGLLNLKHLVGAAPMILRDNTVIEDAGLIKYADGELHSLFINEPFLNNQTYFGNTSWVRDVNALSGNMALVRRKELAEFITHNPTLSPRIALKEFTLEQTDKGQYSVIFSDVLFDNHSVRVKPRMDGKSFFNSNLLPVGNSFEIYTSESAAINILLNLQEQESLKHAKK